MTRQSMFMVFLHIFDQLVLGAVKCDLCPGLGFAEQVGNVAKVQLAEHAQREDLAVRLFEPVQGGVDAQGLFFVGQQLKISSGAASSCVPRRGRRAFGGGALL